MRFLSIELENIFTYRNKVRVDLSSTTADRNIVLIRGRNGAGKTSFLSAVKALFTGLSAPEYREVGFPPTKISLDAYVLGSPTANWMGLLNQYAAHEAKSRKQPVIASVKAELEINGSKIIAERSWTYDGYGFTEQIVVVAAGDRLVGEAADDYLQSLIPRDTVRFFFYDGDEIRALADSLGRQWFDFDKLLGLSFLKTLHEELEDIAKERSRQSLSQATRNELDICEAALRRSKREQVAAQDELSQVEEHLAKHMLDLSRLQSRRENLREGASELHREDLLERKDQTSNALEELDAQISEEIPTWAPVLVNLSLMHAAQQVAGDLITTSGSASLTLSHKIESKLPEWLAEPPVDVPPEFHSKILAIFKKKISTLLEAPSGDGLFSKLSAGRIHELRDRLQAMTSAGEEKKRIQLSKLRDAVQKKLLLTQLTDGLLRLEVSSQTKLDEYKTTVERVEAIQDLISKDNQRKGVLQKNIADAEGEITIRTKKLATLESAVERGRADAHQAKKIATFARTMDEIRLALREAVRLEVAVGLNDHLMELITGPTPITKVNLDENYNTSYEGREKTFLGGASLSSGTRQLVATALVWSLKDSSGLKMPVIIDTPLGRIDRENQTRLLTQYYPNISHQVIILPTSSEIDEGNLHMIEDRVAAQYQIDADSIEHGPEIRLVHSRINIHG